MFDGVRFQYSLVFVRFLFSERSDFVLIWLFYSFRHLWFTAFHISMAHFSMPNSFPISSLYILATLYSGSTLQFSLVFLINFVSSPDILYISRHSIIQFYRTMSYAFFHAIARFFYLILLSLLICSSIYCSSPVPLVHLRHPFCSSGNILRLISES